jgi:hypothetical protein
MDEVETVDRSIVGEVDPILIDGDLIVDVGVVVVGGTNILCAISIFRIDFDFCIILSRFFWE